MFENFMNKVLGSKQEQSEEEIQKEIEALLSERLYMLQDRVSSDGSKLEKINSRLKELGYIENTPQETGMVSSRLEELEKKQNEFALEKIIEMPPQNLEYQELIKEPTAEESLRALEENLDKAA